MYILHLILVACCIVAQNATQDTKSEKSNASFAVTPVSLFVTTPTLSIEDEMAYANLTNETTTCEANSSCSITTVEPINDTLIDTNTTKKSGPKKKRLELTGTGKELCTCNLQQNVCDVNCCCDHECSRDDKLIFHHCETENVYYDTRYCDYMKYIYINNTPFQWHVNQNGLFCVLKSNLPPSRIVQRQKPLKSFDAAQHEKVNRFSWPEVIEKEEIKLNTSESFVYGNNLWIIHGNNIKKLKVPSKYFSNTCLTNKDVFILKNMKSKCAQIDISEENEYLHFKNYFRNITVISIPKYLNISKYKNIQDCPRNICLAILPKLCDEDFNNCQNISRINSSLDFKCNFDIRNNRNICKNALKSLKYNFYHNGTKGLIKIELLSVLKNVSYEFGAKDFEFVQEFEVNFWWVNQTRNFSAMLSGNPGYLIGKPILTGNLVNVGNSTNVTLKIERNPNDYTKSFLVVPKNVKGNCVLNNTNYIPIEFGYSLLTKCRFSTTVVNKGRKYNGTEICRQIQRTVLRMWRVTDKNKTVGMFGNANVNLPGDWTKIMYSSSIEKLLNKTTGRFTSGNKTLLCFGLVKNLVIDVFHSRIDFKTLLNQEKILGVTYSFGGTINKTLVYNKTNNSTFLELDLDSRVVFYDITVEKKKKFVDPPSLEIKLPYDFFYPFVKVDNGVELSSMSFLLYVVCLMILFI